MPAGLCARHDLRLVGGLLVLVLVGATLPAVSQEAPGEVPITIRADFYVVDQPAQILTARGNVVLTMRDITIRSDTLVVDLRAGTLTAEGRVRVEAEGHEVEAEMLTFDLRTHSGTLVRARADYRSPLILGRVRLEARQLEGDPRRLLTVREGFVTTCEGPEPLVFATANQLQIFPNDKIVGRRVSLWVAGGRWLTVPYFVVFLRERRETRISPVVGYTETEGWFVRTSWAYVLSEDHVGFVHADWFERLGVGTGVEHIYQAGDGGGSVFAYRLANRQTGRDDLRAVLTHQQQAGDVSARLFADYSEMSVVGGPGTVNLFTSLDLATRTPDSSTFLYGSWSQASPGDLATLFSQFVHTRSVGSRLWTEALATFSAIKTPDGTDEELFPRLTARHYGEGWATTVVAEWRQDLDGDRFLADERYTLERLPELTVDLYPWGVGGTGLQAQFTLGWAQFRETVPGPGGRVLEAGRTDARATLSGALSLAPGVLTLRAFGRQSWYATGDALSVTGGRAEYTLPIGSATVIGVGYTAQAPTGTSPFVFDQVAGVLSVADARFAVRTPHLSVAVSGFYDFQTGLFGAAVGQMVYAPRPDWTFGFAAGYNLNTGQLERAEASVDVRLSPQWRLEYSGAWDAFTQTVVHNRVAITRTFCDCLAVSLTYLGARNELWLEAWLTAIPWGRGKLGIGAQGTLLFEQPWLVPQR